MRLNRGSDLKTLITELGMTQRELARLVGVHETFIHALIAGTKGCKAVTAMLIVDALRRKGKPDLTIGALFLDRIQPAERVNVPTPKTSSTVQDVA